jgi:superfamily II DNA helicase RecQ
MVAGLKQAGLIVERRGSRYELRSTLLSASIESSAAAYEDRRQRDQAELEQMVIYAQTTLCRTRILLEALGEVVEWSQCGTCDNCRGVSIRPEAAAVGAALLTTSRFIWESEFLQRAIFVLLTTVRPLGRRRIRGSRA